MMSGAMNLSTHDESNSCSFASCCGRPNEDGNINGAANGNIAFKDGDRLLAKEMLNLSVNEREKLYEELHCVQNDFEEVPGFVDNSLTELEKEIQKIHQRSCYNKALFLNPSLVKGRPFQLKFLRASRFDVKYAAFRIVKHFEYKSMLFGDEKVAKTITLDDLDEEGIQILNSGYVQWLDERDSAGRPVLFQYPKLASWNSYESAARAFWYRSMVAAEDEDLQIRGAVLIGYAVGSGVVQNANLREVILKFHILRDGLPLKLACFHHCSDGHGMVHLVNLFRTLSGTRVRLRFRYHLGSHTECQYHLASFGIPRSALPIDDHGEAVTDNAKRFVTERRELESVANENEKKSDMIAVARSCDVILGRGRAAQLHPGNVELIKLAEEREEQYLKAEKFTKTVISLEIMGIIQKRGGRFLELDGSTNLWKSVSQDRARDKVANLFRSFRKPNRGGAGRQAREKVSLWGNEFVDPEAGGSDDTRKRLRENI